VTAPKTRPTMFMIAGPNGAGKSTLYETRIKPKTEAPFINADKIQKNELDDQSVAGAYKAAEIAEERRREHLVSGKSFVSESTFSHPSKLELLSDATAAGFRVVLYHVNVKNADLSVERVSRRVRQGGHDVPEDKIRERYERNQSLIRKAALQADRTFIYDNSIIGKPPRLLIELRAGDVHRVAENIPEWARTLYSKELENVSEHRLNPAAASFKEATEIAQRLEGPESKVVVPKTRAAAYEGVIVGESSLHWLQRNDIGLYSAHFKSAVATDVGLNQATAFTYHNRQLAETTKLHPTPVDADAWQRSQDFLNKPKDEALAKHPSLFAAYAVMDAFVQKASPVDLTDKQRDTMVSRAAAHVASGIVMGRLAKPPHELTKDAQDRKPPERGR
jgi:predicted ABC-type ATPase